MTHRKWLQKPISTPLLIPIVPQPHCIENTQTQNQHPHANHQSCLLALGRVLGDGLCALGDGVLGQLTRQDESDGGLNFSGRDGGLLVVGSKLGGLGGDALKDIVDERVQDGHGAVGDTSIRVNLLEDLVDVRGVGFLPGLATLLLFARWGGSGLLASFLLLSGSRGFASWGLAASGGLLLSSFGSHF